jgi:hypothetical protein
MLQEFNETFGTGVEDTVAEDHWTEGPKHCPKVYPFCC